jgi:Ser/Thr protein kinase RdoA (MazF antagonist)
LEIGGHRLHSESNEPVDQLLAPDVGEIPATERSIAGPDMIRVRATREAAVEQTLDTLKRLGVGRTAEVFTWDGGRALRLFRTGASLPYAVREMNAFRCANEAGLPCPGVYPSDDEHGLVRIGDRLGFVMDRVDGPSMLGTLSRRPWLLVRYARRLAALHLSVHSKEVPALPSQREGFRAVIERLRDDLGDELTDRIQRALDALPDGRVVCHGDFHPDNIILAESGETIIDWGPATFGSAAADVAWTDYLFRHAGYPPGTAWWQRFMIFLLRRAFLAVYQRAYEQGAPFDWSEVKAWEAVNAAVRLGDGIPEERAFLLSFLHKRFGSQRQATRPA